MFNFISYAELASIIRSGITKIPTDVDLIVGVPRSGMVPAFMAGLLLNKSVIDIESFLVGGRPGHGHTRNVAQPLETASDAKSILLIDDSVNSGESMGQALARIRSTGYSGNIRTCAILASPEGRKGVDVFLRTVHHPRVFEWNALHHPCVELSCFDLDGVLCRDPLPEENDDGSRYVKFLREAPPLFIPSRKLGQIVTARLEKYRSLTSEWLRSNQIEYGGLHMMQLSSSSERRKRGTHHEHKASVYKETGAMLFYESDPDQARQIAAISRKPVLCVGNMQLYRPSTLDPLASVGYARWFLRRFVLRAQP